MWSNYLFGEAFFALFLCYCLLIAPFHQLKVYLTCSLNWTAVMTFTNKKGIFFLFKDLEFIVFDCVNFFSIPGTAFHLSQSSKCISLYTSLKNRWKYSWPRKEARVKKSEMFSVSQLSFWIYVNICIYVKNHPLY